MRFTCTVAALRQAVADAAAAVPATPTQVAYSAVLLVVEAPPGEDGVLTVTGTDGDTTVTSRAEVIDAVPGQVLLPPRPLAAWLAGRDARHRVSAEVGPDGLAVRTERGGAFSFRSLAARLTPQVARGEQSAADLSALKGALAAVRPACDRRAPLVHLSCQAQGGELALSATDLFRITRARLSGAGWGQFDGVLPLPALERVVRAEGTSVAFDSMARMLRVVGQGAEVSARLSATAFPETGGMFEHAAVHTVTLARSDLASAVASVAAVAGDATLRLEVTGSLLAVSADNVDTGSGSEQVQLPTPAASEVVLHLKPAYVLDALAAVPSASVTLGWSAPNAAVIVSGEADGLAVDSLVMPVRVA